MRVFTLALAAAAVLSAAAIQTQGNVTRATLANGLHVVVVRDPLAPVVTVQDNYLVGADETPAGFPGMAHAQEHMAFRGCTGLTADQIAAIYAQLGGQNDADTQQNITQYFATVPAANLDVVLRADAACMGHIDDAQAQWDEERGAIEQEVARDLSNPTYKFLTRLNEDMFAGTPYAHDALGTKPSFDKTTGAMLQDFYKKWYAPNNAILVITGNLDPAAAIARIEKIYGSIPRHALPPRPQVKLQPVHAESFTLESNLPYQLLFIAYRMPGTDSVSDYAAARLAGDVLSSERAELYDLVVKGEALASEFAIEETYPQASVGFAVAALPPNADAAPLVEKMKNIIAGYVSKGFPSDLVEAARRMEISSDEFRRNSIPGLAQNWSQALAAEHRTSPDEDVNAIRQVSLAEVNRVAKMYFENQNAIVAVLKPQPSGKAVPSQGFGGAEKITSAPTKPVTLPDWAQAELSKLAVPSSDVHPSDVTLPNGIRLIVQTEHISQTITLSGQIHHETDLETPPGQDGVADIVDELFSYGTKARSRLELRKALDDIAADESAGASFSLRILKSHFDRGMELLADNELNPAFPADSFKIVRQQTAEVAGGQLNSPEYHAERALEIGLYPKGDPNLRQTTPQTVNSVTLDDVKQYYAKTFRPDLTTIVVIGDITPEEAKAEVEKYFGAWKGEGPKPGVTLPPVPMNKPSAVEVPDPARIQDSVVLAENVEINRFSPDYYPLQLGNHVLGGGFYATRLYHDLREVAGLVYNVDDSLSATKTRAVYSVTYGCNPENVSKARAIIRRDLVAMQTDDVSEPELRQAKALLLRQIPLAESSEGAIDDGLLARALMGLPLDEPVVAAKRYFSMSAADVRAAFAKWIRADDFVQVVRGPAPK
ncbi:MAG TPA: pitrilysin family protein [Bryobacteraceae bacterium]|nr:pitrilysin family protein [Bryobacteraceae bacterium]